MNTIKKRFISRCNVYLPRALKANKERISNRVLSERWNGYICAYRVISPLRTQIYHQRQQNNWKSCFKRCNVWYTYYKRIISEWWNELNKVIACSETMYTLLTCLTLPHYVSMCLSLDKSLKLSSYRLFLCYIFVFRLFFCIWNTAVSFVVWIVWNCHIWAFYRWLHGLGYAHCWRLYSEL